MPDIEKIKINAKTAVLAMVGMAASIFLAGGWFFGIRQMQTDVVDMKALLIKFNEHLVETDKRVFLLEKDVEMIKNYNSIRSSRGPQP